MEHIDVQHGIYAALMRYSCQQTHSIRMVLPVGETLFCCPRISHIELWDPATCNSTTEQPPSRSALNSQGYNLMRGGCLLSIKRTWHNDAYSVRCKYLCCHLGKTATGPCSSKLLVQGKEGTLCNGLKGRSSRITGSDRSSFT